MQPSPEAHHISQTFQTDFDRMLFNALEEHHSSTGFTLLLGSILQYRNVIQPSDTFPPGLVASLYWVRQHGEGHILDDMGLYGIYDITGEVEGTTDFLTYFVQLLENPERSGTHTFDQRRYATAAKESLQLYLCNHHKFSKGATDSDLHDKVLQWQYISQHDCPPQGSSKYEHYRSLAYEWALDLLPIFLEESAISLELADVLRSCTFTKMAQQFPRKMSLAREAITTYLLQVDSAVGGL